MVLILRQHCRNRGLSPHGLEKFISALKATKLQSTTSVSLVVFKCLHGSRVSVNRCVCSKCVFSPGSSATVIIVCTWIVMSLDKKMHKEKKKKKITRGINEISHI